MSQRELFINLLLLAGIFYLAYLIIMLEPEVHKERYTDERIASITDAVPTAVVETTYIPESSETQITVTSNTGNIERAREKARKEFPDYFDQPLFDPLIPTPTPTTPPPPTPTAPADLAQAISGVWVMQYVDTGLAAFQDSGSNEFFDIKVGESRQVQWGKYTLDVKLKSVNLEEFSATVGFEDQEYKFAW
jgi:hypothetical protein